jgi:hypothetical protein
LKVEIAGRKETSVAVAGTDVGEASAEAVTPCAGDMRIVRRRLGIEVTETEERVLT